MRKLIVIQIILAVVLNIVGIMSFAGCSKKLKKVPFPEIEEMAAEAPARAVKPRKGLVMSEDIPAREQSVSVQRVTLYFGFDSDVPVVSELMKLDRLDLAGKRIDLVGATCPIGRVVYNHDLGMRRALVIYTYLVDNLGVSDVRWSSCGENDLVSDNPNEYNLNRRCEVKVR